MKQFSPAARRNCEPIADVLQPELPAVGTVLEIASGTGQHIAYFAGRFDHLSWRPSDVSPGALASIRAWRDELGLDNLLAPLALDVSASSWPVERVEAVININMAHISPWDASRSMLRGAGRCLVPGGLLFVYGPYRVRGRPTAPSNEAFDASLKSRNPSWGLRYLHEMAEEAATHGLVLQDTRDMPANNLALIFRRQPAS